MWGNQDACIYQALVVSPGGINVTVVPKVLAFARYGQKISSTVSFKAVAPPQGCVRIIDMEVCEN